MSDLEKRLALCLSLLFPGLGLIFKRKYLAGIICVLIHAILGFFLFRFYIDSVVSSYPMDGDMLLIFLFILVLNYVASAVLSVQSEVEAP